MKEMLNLSVRLALICGVAALALSNVDAVTREPIARAQAQARREAVAAVLPAFAELAADTLGAVPGAGRIYYVGRSGGRIAGTAFTARTDRGYSGLIEVMVGVDSTGTVNGVRILRHAETPGLGANYAAPAVLDRLFRGRTAADDWKVRSDGGTVDAITGATVTGRALADAVERGLTDYQHDRTALPPPAPRPQPGGTQ